MLTSPVGLSPEKGCAGDAQQKLKTIDTTSPQRGRPHQARPVRRADILTAICEPVV
jgi:hypothetical protein